MSEEKRNMKISGSGSMPGGEFDKVSVSGAGKVDGSLRCEELNCSGSAKIAGNARVAERLHCSGSVKVEGDVGCGGVMHVSGAFQCGGDAAAQEFHGSGATRIGGELSGTELHVSGVLHAASVHCTELRASGSLDIDGGVEAERAALSGVVKIGGLLNAEKLEFYPGGHCEVGDIGGADIRVLRSTTPNSLLSLLRFTSPAGTLSVRTIEGDYVELENVTAESVSGKTVRIGEGCHIQHVEYSESLDAAPGTVGESFKAE